MQVKFSYPVRYVKKTHGKVFNLAGSLGCAPPGAQQKNTRETKLPRCSLLISISTYLKKVILPQELHYQCNMASDTVYLHPQRY